jgi:hypothetical protein
MMHGRGTFMWAKGDMYEGEWSMGKMHGQGTKQMANGDVYEGRWQSGMADGWGKKRFSCGDLHEGCVRSSRLPAAPLVGTCARTPERNAAFPCRPSIPPFALPPPTPATPPVTRRKRFARPFGTLR